MALLHRLKEIENELGNAQRPESTLLHRYEVLDDFKKKEFVIALIGKLIELDRRLYVASMKP
ncbi:hypothetical protein MXF13_09000 [Leclercia adecarboxylata]|uniref:hypothetical protein n=1 Tax=Leclercia adecarboxylata TaxID=83655 RepID=UPI002DB6B6ED|nr:hypothetical protein [Leclercia adecarboxylata]MEB5750013.1 hypothetical protein [Leclercia adecarboxylata]